MVKAIFKIFSYFIYTLTQNWTHYKNIFPETMYQLYQLTYLFGHFRTLSLCLPPSKQNGASCQNPSKVNYHENCPETGQIFSETLFKKYNLLPKKRVLNYWYIARYTVQKSWHRGIEDCRCLFTYIFVSFLYLLQKKCKKSGQSHKRIPKEPIAARF